MTNPERTDVEGQWEVWTKKGAAYLCHATDGDDCIGPFPDGLAAQRVLDTIRALRSEVVELRKLPTWRSLRLEVGKAEAQAARLFEASVDQGARITALEAELSRKDAALREIAEDEAPEMLGNVMGVRLQGIARQARASEPGQVGDSPVRCECGHWLHSHESAPLMPCLVEGCDCDTFEPGQEGGADAPLVLIYPLDRETENIPPQEWTGEVWSDRPVRVLISTDEGNEADLREPNPMSKDMVEAFRELLAAPTDEPGAGEVGSDGE